MLHCFHCRSRALIDVGLWQELVEGTDELGIPTEEDLHAIRHAFCADAAVYVLDRVNKVPLKS